MYAGAEGSETFETTGLVTFTDTVTLAVMFGRPVSIETVELAGTVALAERVELIERSKPPVVS